MKIKAIIFSVTLLLLSLVIISFVSKENETSFIIIKTIEKPHGPGGQAGAIAVYKDGAILERGELIDLEGSTIDFNLKIIGNKIKKYQSEGYQLISSAGGGAMNTITFTYILEKK